MHIDEIQTLYQKNLENLCIDFYPTYLELYQKKLLKIDPIYFNYVRELLKVDYSTKYLESFILNTSNSWTLFKLNSLEFISNYGYLIFAELALPNISANQTILNIFEHNILHFLSSDDKDCLISYFEAFIKLALKFIKINEKYDKINYQNDFEIFGI